MDSRFSQQNDSLCFDELKFEEADLAAQIDAVLKQTVTQETENPFYEQLPTLDDLPVSPLAADFDIEAFLNAIPSEPMSSRQFRHNSYVRGYNAGKRGKPCPDTAELDQASLQQGHKAGLKKYAEQVDTDYAQHSEEQSSDLDIETISCDSADAELEAFSPSARPTNVPSHLLRVNFKIGMYSATAYMHKDKDHEQQANHQFNALSM